MNIAFLSMGNEMGGAAQDILTLSQGLSDLGHKVFVISQRGVLDKELEDKDVQFIDTPLYTRNPLRLILASRKLREIAKKNRIEIMNPQGMYTAFSIWLARFGLGPVRYKVITTIHMISQLKLYRFAWVLNIFSTKIITESRCEMDRLISGGVRKDKITVIHNSVDMERFSTKNTFPVLWNEYGIPKDHFCFGIVARLSLEKRHTDFIDAAKMVHDLNSNTKFFIVGGGPLNESIKTAIDGAEEYIIMTGPRRDIPNVLKSLDCFVLCSELESLPLSIREAMSMKLPVIATDVGGIGEAVIHSKTGLLVPPHQPQKLSEAMIKLINNLEFRTRLALQGFNKCKEKFELKDWSKKTEKLFQDVWNS